MNAEAAQGAHMAGAKEARVLLALLVVLLAAAYLSWTQKEETASADRVALLEIEPGNVASISMVTTTQTVTVARRQTADDKPYVWFDVKSALRAQSFVGNKSADEVWKTFAPLYAMRSLGSSLTDKQLVDMKLSPPDGKLTVNVGSAPRTFELGGRTYGTRDWYVRPTGSKEVFLVSIKALSDLEYPEQRFMQRQLTSLDIKDVTSVTLKAGTVEKQMLHQNRLSEKDSYWTDAKTPDTRNETIENYVEKVNKLAATKFVEADKVKDATPVLEFAWHEDDKVKERMTLYRTRDEKPVYLAVSTATLLPVEVPKSAAEQLEQDLAVVLAD